MVLDEKERDYRLGARAIVLEEFVLTILYFPHMIALPAKVISYLLAKLHIERYFTSSRFVRREFVQQIYDLDHSAYQEAEIITQDLLTAYNSMSNLANDFYHVQLLLLIEVGMLLFGTIELINWGLLKIEFTAMKILSGFSCVPLNRLNQNMAIARPRGLFWLQLLQIPFALMMVMFRASLVFYPIYLNFKYSDYSWIGCVLGPGFINLPSYGIFYLNISTAFYYRSHFRYFTPYETMLSAMQFVVIHPYTLILASMKFCIACVKGLARPLKFIKRILTSNSVGVVKTYIKILYTAGRVLKPFRIVGDLLFIPVTLTWMWWPLAVCYLLGEMWLWVPTTVLTLYLTVKGYSIANKAWA